VDIALARSCGCHADHPAKVTLPNDRSLGNQSELAEPRRRPINATSKGAVPKKGRRKTIPHTHAAQLLDPTDLALQQVGGFPGHTGRDANLLGEATYLQLTCRQRRECSPTSG
jgi:hypothetical protein